MFKETKARSIIKTFSWRVLATLTTATLVFIFTGELTIAITIGSIEVVAKILLYFFHERLWDKVNIGRKEIKPFVIWFTGLPSSGKTTIANALTKKLLKRAYTLERLYGDKVRQLFPDEGFSKLERDSHIKRVGLLSSILEKNKVIVVASFVSPYIEARDFVRGICQNFIEVYINTPANICEKYDKKGLYKRAKSGLIKNFTGVNDPYQEPKDPEITLSIESLSLDDCVNRVLDYLKQNKFLV